MFKLAFNSTTLRNIDVFTSLRYIKDYGYDGVELTLNDTPPPSPATQLQKMHGCP